MSKERTRRSYKKPEIKRVKLKIQEAVLQPCKASDGDTAGKGNKWCGHPGCSTTFGT
ncbi:MAG: hypothetical protein PVI20_19590 [Desulfobacteraceae bacterium]|jgi:hypothetical protein